MDLRKYARGKDCDIRIAGRCRGQPEYSVWCHVRMIGITGMGLKAPDVLGCVGCDICHGIVDGQIKDMYGPGERRLFLLEGVMRRQAKLVEEEILQW